MAPTKILLTGATGHIGGSILTLLLKPDSGILSRTSISVLIRGEEKVQTFKDLGVTPILFKSLEDSDFLRKTASDNDIIIHTASGYHTSSARSLILGLGDRTAVNAGAKVHYIHTTGTSNLADQPISGAYEESPVRIFSDTEAIYAYEKTREALQPYAQRTTDIVVGETGLSVHVPTTLIMSPTIYGVGTGLFNTLSIQGPSMMRYAIAAGRVEMIGSGEGMWDFVHVKDLAELYLILLKKVLAGDDDIPSDERGIIFSFVRIGALESREVASITLEEAAKWANGSVLTAELGFASNARTVSDIALGMGWKPVKTDEDFEASSLEEAALVIKDPTPRSW